MLPTSNRQRGDELVVKTRGPVQRGRPRACQKKGTEMKRLLVMSLSVSVVIGTMDLHWLKVATQLDPYLDLGFCIVHRIVRGMDILHSETSSGATQDPTVPC